jgi:hypothetical protein
VFGTGRLNASPEDLARTPPARLPRRLRGPFIMTSHPASPPSGFRNVLRLGVFVAWKTYGRVAEPAHPRCCPPRGVTSRPSGESLRPSDASNLDPC